MLSTDFVDRKTQYPALKPSIDARIQKVLDHGQYILGPEVIELESALAKYGGATIVNDDALAKACKEIRVHGQSARHADSSFKALFSAGRFVAMAMGPA